MLLRYLLFVSAFLLLEPVLGGFIRSTPLPEANCSTVALAPLVVYVAIDAQKKLMKFLINTKVIDPADSGTSNDSQAIGPLITDVNPATNRYTTLNVEIQFMGNTFVRKNLRFCDILAVKDTSPSQISRGISSSQTSSATSSTSQSVSVAAATGLPPRVGYSNQSLSEDVEAANVSSTISKDSFVPITSLLQNSMSPLISKSNATIASLFANLTSSGPACPLYVNDSIVFYYQADISANMNRFGSYYAKFTIVSNNESSDIIGGATGYVTSTITSYGTLRIFFFGAIAVVMLSGLAYFVIMVVSPDQESQNPFLIEASAICNARLLKQLGAPPSALFSYLQFALFMTGLNLQYPEFFPHMVAQIRWSSLLGFNVLHGLTSLPPYKRDNVYLTYYPGFRAIGLYNANNYSRYSWANFVLCLSVWTLAGIVGYQIFIFFKILAVKTFFGSISRKVRERSSTGIVHLDGARKESGFRYSFSTNMWALLGHLLREYLTTFSFPFLVLTIYMLITAARWDSHPEQTIGMNETRAFSSTLPYYSMPTNSFSPYAGRALVTNYPGIPAGSVVFGAVLLVAWLAACFIFLYHYISPVSWRGKRKSHVTKLYSSVRTIVTWAYLYNEYKPSRSYFVAVDLISCVLSSVVIAAMQYVPSAQVALIIVIESAKLALLLILRPLFLEMKWFSLPVVMSVARAVVAFLNIAFLKQLRISEVNRSRVAFAHMFIHITVVFVYVVHLFYCLSLAMWAIFKAHKKRRKNKDVLHGEPLADSMFNEFEFKQVPMSSSARHEFDPTDVQASIASSVDDREIDYFRASKKAAHDGHQDLSSDNKDPGSESADDISIDYEESKSRIRRTDYTTREGDRIYNKYFTDQEIDPEMRELWNSRDWRSTIKPLPAKAEDASASRGKLRNWRTLFSPAKKEQGFEVVRRRPIVVADATLKVDSESTHGAADPAHNLLIH